MLHSMTGFARQSVESPLGTLTCELRAVNHRYLDLQFRLPDQLRAKEVDLRQQLGAALKRGKVECNMHLRAASGDTRELRLNDQLVRELAARSSEVGAIMPDVAAPTALDVLRWPGVLQEPEIETEPLYEHANNLLDAALAALSGMRRSEGERIGQMIESRCEDILELASGVRKRMPEVLQAVRNRQQERLQKLDIEADPQRLEVELALVAQKLDVDEELDRLESHVSEIRNVLTLDEPVGRRLDFLMQELNREANTLGSKSADTETTRASVELKVLIEQIREQIQNVE
jgi:uncharacterized protein (TIGR00255 family)